MLRQHFFRKMTFLAPNAILYTPPNFKQTEKKQEMLKKYSEGKRQMVMDARKDGATIAQIAAQVEVGHG